MKRFKGYAYRQAGFTLIEVLVIMFIISTLSTVLVVNWRKNEKRYQLQRSAQTVVQNFRKVQSMSLAGKNLCDQDSPCIPRNYGVHFGKTTLTSYVIFADKNNNGKYASAVETNEHIETIYLESGIELSLSVDLDVVFSVPDGFVMINAKPLTTEASLTIKRSGTTCPSSNCKIIIIKKSGQITIQ
ncbi:type II secretion system GspH family protein [Patescibacteria group bacterium]|nr:type II secretion system GspH family protein [Patescibacteria group bacterium]MBU4458406.1 type II secretion system GspH family protein [Patescibacteria group bacterium]MCG2695839.1 type II secretion system GspH family protein [Candidatus Portnoybacteria bacterium]